jgi:hypothetical protein
MIDLSRNCLFCGSDKGLNTTMTVKIGDTDFKVAVCEAHEDEASPKAVREKAGEKAREIQELKEKAEKLGLKIGEETRPEPLAPVAPPPSAPKADDRRRFHHGMKQQNAPAETPEEAEAEAPAPTVAEIAEESVAEVPVDPGMGIQSHSSYNPTNIDGGEKLETIQKTKQVIQTSDGRPVHIPKTLHDSAGGRTDIRVVNTGGDAALQRRFKQLGQASKAEAAPSPDFRHGYTVRDCRACNGTGVSRVDQKKQCPKCGGDGFTKAQ